MRRAVKSWFPAGRGEAENRIKELKALSMDRTNCHRFLANQFRLILHAAAFVLLSFLRCQLADTELTSAQVATIQRKLLRLSVLVKETCRRVGLPFNKLMALSTPQGTLLQAARCSTCGCCLGTASARHPANRPPCDPHIGPHGPAQASLRLAGRFSPAFHPQPC